MDNNQTNSSGHARGDPPATVVNFQRERKLNEIAAMLHDCSIKKTAGGVGVKRADFQKREALQKIINLFRGWSDERIETFGEALSFVKRIWEAQGEELFAVILLIEKAIAGFSAA